MRYGIIALLSFFALSNVALSSAAQAHTHHRHHHYRVHRDKAPQVATFGFFGFPQFPAQPEPVRYSGGEVVSHPSGCPRTAFCGCGVSVRVFGRSVRELWLAANWYRYPRTSPGAGMVAIFGRHHVAYIESYNGDGTAVLYDPNSGGHLTRVHRVRISGAAIVNPHGA